MATRHNLALDMFGQNVGLCHLAEGLLLATQEAELEGQEPTLDPAVLLLSYQLSFLTHTDSMPRRMVNDLIRMCESNRCTPVDPVHIRSH